MSDGADTAVPPTRNPAPTQDNVERYDSRRGALRHLIETRDWTDSPLGPRDGWPPSLRAAVDLMLPAMAQIVLFWGPDYCALYNDAYAPSIGDKHPRALGRPARENWAELWDDLEPLLRTVRETGETVFAKDRPFYIERHGYPETVHFDISYSPVPDESGGVGGVLCIVSETTERVAAAETLRGSEARARESEARFHAMADSIDQMIWSTLPDGYHDYYNRRWYEYTGVPEGSTDGEAWNGMFHPDDQERAWGVWRQCLATGEPYHIEYRLRHRSGQYRWVLGRAQPVRDASGAITRWYGTCTDIDDFKRAEGALRQSEERFREVFQNAGVGMIEIDADWNILASNAAYCRITGRPEDELRGANCLSFTHADDIGAGEEALRSLADGATRQISFEKRYLRPDGAVIWVRSNLSRISDDKGANRFLKVVEDITDIRRVREALRESEERYRTLFESIDEGFCVIEFLDGPHGSLSDYVHVSANPAYEQHAGIPDVVGQKVRDMVPDEADRWVAMYREVLLSGVPIRFEQELEATGRHLDLAAFRIEPAERRQVAVLFRDITARRRAEAELRSLTETLELRVAEEIERRSNAEEALRQSQKMEAVGQLTGGIAHDFNNLLTIVTGNVDAARRHLGDAAEARVQRALSNALVGAERAAVLTQRLLAFSRRQPLDPKPVDANKLVAGMSDLLHSTLGETIAVETVLAAGLWRIEADPHQLENAIINLAVNARDAMGGEGAGSGKLTIETANTHFDRDYAAQNPGISPGQYVAICVSDTGTGMSEETLERAFEPFFTTKEVGRGTGLGLSMVYGFVKQSGGHVKIYSELGEGTTVRIYLPRLVGPADEEKEERSQHVPEGSRDETILVCEDDDDVRAYSVEVLRELGYRVLEAHDGMSALRLLERQEGKVDLLFTDVVLPGGMTGADVAREARALRPDLKILFTTGYARNAIVHHGRLDPGVELITKPFAYADLAARIRDLLDRTD